MFKQLLGDSCTLWHAASTTAWCDTLPPALRDVTLYLHRCVPKAIHHVRAMSGAVIYDYEIAAWRETATSQLYVSTIVNRKQCALKVLIFENVATSIKLWGRGKVECSNID